MVFSKLLSDIASAGLAVPERLVGASEAEIEEMRIDQNVDRLPGRYLEFLRVMGRDAGPIWAGTDAFYPNILSFRGEAEDVLREGGLEEVISADTFIFAIHQGYQVYWLSNTKDEDPPVAMFQEGSYGITRAWPRFTDCLIEDGCAALH